MPRNKKKNGSETGEEKKKKRFLAPERNDVRAKLVLMAQYLAKGYSVRKALKLAGVSASTYSKYKDFVWGLARSYNPNVLKWSRKEDSVMLEKPEEIPKEEVKESEKAVEEMAKKFSSVVDQTQHGINQNTTIAKPGMPYNATHGPAPPPIDMMNPFDSLDTLAIQLENAINSITKFQNSLQKIATKIMSMQGGRGYYTSPDEPPMFFPDEMPEETTTPPTPKRVETPKVETPQVEGISTDLQKLLTISDLIDKYKLTLENLKKQIEALAEKFGYTLVNKNQVMTKEEKEKMLRELAEELGYELKKKLIPYEEAKREAIQEVKKEISKELEEKKIEAAKELVGELIKGFFGIMKATLQGRLDKVPAIALETESKINETTKVLEKLIAGEEEKEGEEE